MKKTIILTGAFGYIGSHTAKVFKQAGYEVYGIDREHTIPEAAPFLDIWLRSDFADAVPTLLSNNLDVEAIVHCAGTSLVGPSIDNPGLYYDNNTAKTNQMLHEIRNLDWSGLVVFSSSAAVYGNNCVSPIEESADGFPVSPYGWSKKFCEQVIHDHCLAHGMRGIALRYFNAAGCDISGELGHVRDDTHIIPRILSAYQNRSKFILNGNDFKTPDGTCIRDYLHVEDIARAHLAAVTFGQNLDFGKFRSYNLGTGQGYSNLQVVESCERAFGASLTYQIGDRRIGDPDILVADGSKFQNDSLWVPKYSDIDVICKSAWAWQKNISML